jgi:hypothetical protein
MTDRHPTHYIVTAHRHNLVVHTQEAATREEAEALAKRFAAAPGSPVVVDIEEVHDPLETDLTAHTRELLEDMQAKAKDQSS